MKKIISMILLCSMFLSPMFVSAETVKEEQEEVVAQSDKYFKTITSSNLSKEYTVEVSKEEYDNFNESISPCVSGSVETAYKRLSTTIIKNGESYKFQVKLTWKNFPKVRNFDIIGIGFIPSVRAGTSIYFKQEYCYSSGECKTSTTYTPKTFSSGVGANFKLPSGSLKSLSQTLYFYVYKNVDATINTLYAYGDYSHNVSSNVTFEQSKNYTVSPAGIVLDNSLYNSYDEISTSDATLSGLSW